MVAVPLPLMPLLQLMVLVGDSIVCLARHKLDLCFMYIDAQQAMTKPPLFYEERSPEILILFHSSGLTSNQWRKLKNLWFPGRTPFRPSCFGTGKKKRFFAQLAHSAGPTCILYLAEEASDRLEFLPSWDSMDQDLLLLYGQYRSTLVHHMDVEKASDFDELETSLFHFYLPSSYLSFVCSGEGVDLFNLGIPPK